MGVRGGGCMLDIGDIRALHSNNVVVLTDHFMDRLRKRTIKISDVEHIIVSGEIIERYPDSYPHPSALLMGCLSKDAPLHVVVGIGKGLLWLVTAYIPTPDKWEADYKTRKAVE